MVQKIDIFVEPYKENHEKILQRQGFDHMYGVPPYYPAYTAIMEMDCTGEEIVVGYYPHLYCTSPTAEFTVRKVNKKYFNPQEVQEIILYLGNLFS